MSLWALLPAALSLGATYLSKPKKKDFRPNTDYLKRYIANLRGRQSDREAYHMAMQPALRQIGAQGRRAQRQIGYDVEKAGLAGSGIEAQQRLTASRDVLGAMQTASEKATGLQMQESRRLGQQAERGQMQIGAEEDRARRAYEQSQTQWRNQMLQGGVNLATAGVTEYISGLKAAKEAASASNLAYQTALETGEFTGSFEDFKLKAEGMGLTGAQYGKVLGSEPKVIRKDTTFENGKAITTTTYADKTTDVTSTREDKPGDPKVVRETTTYDEAGNKKVTEFDINDNVLKTRTFQVKPGKPAVATTDISWNKDGQKIEIKRDKEGNIISEKKTDERPGTMTQEENKVFRGIQNKMNELIAAKNKEEVFALFNEFGMGINKKVTLEWNEEEYNRLKKLLYDKFPFMREIGQSPEQTEEELDLNKM